MTDELAHRFAYHQPKNASIAEKHEWVRAVLGDIARGMNTTLPEGREKALVFTKLEEAMFWANAAIARIENYKEDNV